MTLKAYISDLTWRSREHQISNIKGALAVDAPEPVIYDGLGEIGMMLRPTRRKIKDQIVISSMAVLADNEDHIINVLGLLRQCGAALYAVEENYNWNGGRTTKAAVEVWRAARRNGAAKAGGDKKSENSERKFWGGFSKIKDRWHLNETSKVLMKEAGIKHHDTIRANLGYTRWEWRKLSDAKRERVLKQKEKEYRNAKR